MVAPHAGAWIETKNPQLLLPTYGSRLMQARGLKQKVTTYADDQIMSRLMQARGLKLTCKNKLSVVISSRLMQARGLKQLRPELQTMLLGRASCRRVD